MSVAEKHHGDWKQAVWRRWAAPVLLVCLVIGFYWKLVLTNQFTWLASSDLSSMVLPWFQFQASEWHSGRIPLWDPYSWGGQPLLAQAQPGSAYPLNWLLFLAPLKHTWIRQAALHWYYVVIRILAALCFYWFCRDLDRSRSAALLGSVVYGIGGYLGSIEWPQMVNSAVWAPLVFLFQFRAIRGRSPLPSSVMSGFFLGLMWLCGHHQVPLFVSIAWGCFWIYSSYASGRRRAVLAVLTAILVSGLQTLPTAEYGRLAQRWSSTDHALKWHEKVPYAVHEDFSFKPVSIISFVVPGLDLNEDPLIGAVAFALAVAGLVSGWADRRVRWLAILALGSVLFALGPNSVFHGFLYSTVPLIEKARVPAHAMLLFHLGVCALVAFGVDGLPALSRRRIAMLGMGLAGLGTVLTVAGFVLFEMHLVPVQGDSRFMVTALAAFVAASLIWATWSGAIGRRAGFGGLLILVLLELGNTSGYFFANYERQKDRIAPLKKMAEDSDIASFLRTQPGRFRVEYDGNVIPHNLGDWWGLETFTSYVASAPDIVMRNEPYHPRVQALWGVRYYIGTKPVRPDQTEVFNGVSGRKVYRNADAFPRAWAVHQVRRVNEPETGRALLDPSLDLRAEAILTSPAPPLAACSGDDVNVRRHLPDTVEIEAAMQCRGLVVLSETYFPGWRATVDGSPATIYATDGMLRGVIIEAGKHKIAMQYRPGSVIAGGIMTLLGTLFAVAVTIVHRRRSTLM